MDAETRLIAVAVIGWAIIAGVVVGVIIAKAGLPVNPRRPTLPKTLQEVFVIPTKEWKSPGVYRET